MKILLIPVIILCCFSLAYGQSAKLSELTPLAAAPAESDLLYIADGGVSKSITTLYLMRILEGALTSFEIHTDNLPTDLVADDYLPLAGGTMTGNLILDDGTTDSPYIRMVDETNEYFGIYKADGTDLVIYTDNASDRTLGILNTGAGVLGVRTDGSVTLDDGDGNSPYLNLTDESDESLTLYKADGSSLYLYTNTATDRTLSIQNNGAGNLNVTMDGSLSVAGSASITGDITVDDLEIGGAITFTSTENSGHEFDNLPDLDQRCTGIMTRVTAGEDDLAFGDLVGKAANGKFVSALATDGASQVVAVGFNCNSGDTDTDDFMVIVIDGYIRNDEVWDLSEQCGINDRTVLYLDDVAGQAVWGDGDLLNGDAGSRPSTSDYLDQKIGWCWNTSNSFGEVLRVKIDEYPSVH